MAFEADPIGDSDQKIQRAADACFDAVHGKLEPPKQKFTLNPIRAAQAVKDKAIAAGGKYMLGKAFRRMDENMVEAGLEVNDEEAVREIIQGTWFELRKVFHLGEESTLDREERQEGREGQIQQAIRCGVGNSVKRIKKVPFGEDVVAGMFKTVDAKMREAGLETADDDVKAVIGNVWSRLKPLYENERAELRVA